MVRSESRGFLLTTLARGLIFLIPVVAIIAILEKALSLVDKVTVPLARLWGLNHVGGLPASRLIAVGLLILICFLAGLFARTAIARRFVVMLEDRLLSKLPGYSFFKSFAESLTGIEEQQGVAVFVCIEEDAWQIAFSMETLQDGQVVVFVPEAPGGMSGSVFIVGPERVRPLDATMAQAMKSLRRLGKGSGALVRR